MITIFDETTSPEATSLAAALVAQHGSRALGHCRMQLYAAVNQRNVGQIRLLTNVCLILMRDAPEREAHRA